MIALLCCAAAWATQARVSLGPAVGSTATKEQSATWAFDLERQIAPRVHLGVGGRALGTPLAWALEPFTGPDLQYAGQALVERSAWWASAEWRALGMQGAQLDLAVGLQAALGARRIQAGDWAELPYLADVILPPDWGYSQHAMAQGGATLHAMRGHWGVQLSAEANLSTLPEHLRGKVSPLTCWSGAAVVFAL